MPGKTGLEPLEGALIKAMWATGDFTKQQITAYFTRPERSINQGRISQIIDGKMMKDVPPASEAQVRAFLASQGDLASTRAKVLLADPLHPTTLSHVLKVDSKRKGHLAISETDLVECKEKIDWDKRERLCRAMAGLANNKGGYVLVGVKDKTFEIQGVPSGKLDVDPATITDYLNKTFVPSIAWDHSVVTFSGKAVVVIYVSPAAKKPIMCIQERNPGTPEGTTLGRVYYRYPGQTTEIRYGELEAIIREREEQVQRRWADLFKKVHTVGVENVAVLDTVSGRIDGPGGSLLIDEALLPKIKFIREGEFEEKKGSPALRIVGDVTTVLSSAIQPIQLRKTAISDRDILKDFIEQIPVDEAEPYLKAIANSQAKWLPIHYFLKASGTKVEQAAALMGTIATNRKDSTTFHVQRVQLKRRPSPLQGASLTKLRQQIKERATIKIDSPDDAVLALRALRGLGRKEIDPAFGFELLNECFTKHYDGPGHRKVAPDLRYAACHLDDLLFTPPDGK